MRFDEHSLYNIMKDAHLTTMQAAISYILLRIRILSKKRRIICGEFHSAIVHYPRSKVLEWFKYQTKQSSMTVELNQPS